MIQIIMLVALGFLLATLIFLLLAPAVWRRAARLATQRLKASLPISLTDFHAEKDQLRAEYAMQIRELEVGLEQAKEKAAQQMVELGAQKGENIALTSQIRDLRSALSEKKSLISVMEQTLNANVPRMKERVEQELGAKLQLSDTVARLESTLKKTTHQLEEADRDLKLREAEIHKLRQLKTAAPHSKATVFSFKRAKSKRDERLAAMMEKKLDLTALGLSEGDKAAIAMQSLHQENIELRAVITRTKAQLAMAKSFEAKEVPALRQEMRRLSAEVMRSANVPAKVADVPRSIATSTAAPVAAQPSPPKGKEKGKSLLDANAGLKGTPASIVGGSPTLLKGKLTSADLQRAKRSLAERLKNVSKATKEADV